MADLSAQGIFYDVFKLLASDPSDQHKRWAKKMWKISEGYDFDPSDLDQKSLKTLGLPYDQDR